MRAAFYECDITPPLGGVMWGHYKEIRAGDVHDRLYARAVVVEDQGEVAAIVAVDTCVIPPEMHDIVTQRIQSYTGIAPERVCITSVHSHSGAPVSDDPTNNCYADAAYRDVFFRLCADAVTLAYKRLAPVDAKFGTTEVHGIAFNRNFVLKDGSIVTHGRGRTDIERTFGETDPELPVLMFWKDGKPIGAIINYACHQDCLGALHRENPGYSGDYTSVLEQKLKEHYGNDFVSVFILGTCGDINHVNPDSSVTIERLHYRKMGEILAAGVIRAMENAQPVSGGVGVLKEAVEIRRRPSDTQTVMELLKKRMEKDKNLMKIRNLVYYNAANKAESTKLYVQVIRIGDVCISALPGEVYVAFGKGIKAASPFKWNMVAENCNSYCGYIPTKEAFCENSDLYEITLCMHSCHVPEAGDIIQAKALELGNKLAN